jgi:hypothetical protein
MPSTDGSPVLHIGPISFLCPLLTKGKGKKRFVSIIKAHMKNKKLKNCITDFKVLSLFVSIRENSWQNLSKLKKILHPRPPFPAQKRGLVQGMKKIPNSYSTSKPQETPLFIEGGI